MTFFDAVQELLSGKAIYREHWIKGNPSTPLHQLTIHGDDDWLTVHRQKGRYLWTPRVDDLSATDWKVEKPS